jgi:hypothetical protein
LITAKFASVSYDNTYTGSSNEKLEINDLDKLVDKLDLDKHDLDNPSTENFSGGAWGKQNLPEKERLKNLEKLRGNIKTLKVQKTGEPSTKEIHRVAYIKEAMNVLEKKLVVPKFLQNTGQGQSSNTSTVFNSDTYVLAMNNLLPEFGRKVSMHPQFLEDVIGGHENTDQDCRKNTDCPRRKLLKSSPEDFEKHVLPKLKEFSRSHGQNGVVLFVHGHFLENILKDNGTRRVWKKAKDPTKQRKNCSIHRITYGNGSRRISVETNLQLGQQIPKGAIKHYLEMMNTRNDPMNKCQYKQSHGEAEIITRAARQIEILNNPVKSMGGHKNPDPLFINATASQAYSNYGGKRKRTRKRTRKRKKKRTRKRTIKRKKKRTRRQRKKKKTRGKKY